MITQPSEVLAGGGEMGALMRSIDWSQTAVGPVAGWPQSLRTALSILLETGFPMYIAWGPRLHPVLQRRLPADPRLDQAPGRHGAGTRETFAEIWDIIGPMFEGVMRGNATTVVDFLLPLDRHGFIEECYFIFSYSPIREEAGGVGGVLVTVTETTERVLGERRLKTLQALAARTRRARRPPTRRCADRGRRPRREPAPTCRSRLLYLLDHDGKRRDARRRRGHRAATPACQPARLIDLGGRGPAGRSRTVRSHEAQRRVDARSDAPAVDGAGHARARAAHRAAGRGGGRPACWSPASARGCCSTTPTADFLDLVAARSPPRSPTRARSRRPRRAPRRWRSSTAPRPPSSATSATSSARR